MLCLNFYFKFNCDFKTEKSKNCFHFVYKYIVNVGNNLIQNMN